jgi:glycosyltransferase involved in cell wall biosynthesis
LVLGLMVGPSVRHAARVITDSQAARRDIVRFYRVSPDKVVVTPAAAGPQYYPQPPGEVERIRRAYDLKERYLLAVGNVQPRKNLPRLVEAFARIASEATDVQLVIVGRSTWKGSEVEATVHRLGVTGRVRFTRYVPDAHLPGLYTGAVTLCYPSLYEGFGLPPLEAMACGTPTVTSNVSSLPEVVGDAAITVNPRSVDEIARALRCMLLDESLRIEYSRRGLARAAMFSWEKTAMLTRKVYEAVLGC